MRGVLSEQGVADRLHTHHDPVDRLRLQHALLDREAFTSDLVRTGGRADLSHASSRPHLPRPNRRIHMRGWKRIRNDSLAVQNDGSVRMASGSSEVVNPCYPEGA